MSGFLLAYFETKFSNFSTSNFCLCQTPSMLLHFSPFGLQQPGHFSQAFLFSLFERRVGVVIVGEHVWPIVHRHDVRVSTTLKQTKSNLSMGSLTGEVESSYTPASVAS